MMAARTSENPARAQAAPEDSSAFDAYAGDYDAQLQSGLSATGEDKNYYAQGRVRWLASRVRSLGARTDSVLDYGCGTGSATPFLISELGAAQVLGVDVSEASIRVAREEYGGPAAAFEVVRDAAPEATMDLAFSNGVFHHIPLDERLGAAAYVHRALRAGGLFALWENNPWNPGTRYVMSRIPFDHDAIPLSVRESRALLRQAGFEIVRTDFLFIFPRALRALRPLEPKLASLPLGGQYLVLARRPMTSNALP